MVGFEGDVVAKWLRHNGADRNMELVESISFVDGNNTLWHVPAGSIVNGASIPSILWSFGSPFVGDYRRASVVHDHFCNTKDREWRATHRMFHEGCLVDGVSALKAKLMYAAVYAGGPRWEATSYDLRVLTNSGLESISPGDKITILPQVRPEVSELLISWVLDNDPSLAEIEARVDNTVENFSTFRD